MLRECEICGKEDNEKWMQSYSSGTRTHWLCWKCYLNSQREAQMSDLHRQQRLHRIHESKKRNK